jgi:hypothetical protein
MSPAKTQRPQRSERRAENHLSNVFYNLSAFAPWRENIRFRVPYDRRSFAQAAKISQHNRTENTEFGRIKGIHGVLNDTGMSPAKHILSEVEGAPGREVNQTVLATTLRRRIG